MKLDALASLPFEARRVVLDELLERLPSWLELVDPSLVQPRFRDARSGEGWRLFTGGTFDLGATDERLARIAELQDRYPLRLSPARLHLPPRRVTVSPFLLMEQAIPEAGSSEPVVLVLQHEVEAKKLLGERAARLPTQAEWEFAMRAVAAQPEHWVLSELELCADGWTAELSSLAEVDPLVPGGPGVVRTASTDPESFESVLPARQPLSGTRLATVRAAMSCSERR